MELADLGGREIAARQVGHGAARVLVHEIDNRQRHAADHGVAVDGGAADDPGFGGSERFGPRCAENEFSVAKNAGRVDRNSRRPFFTVLIAAHRSDTRFVTKHLAKPHAFGAEISRRHGIGQRGYGVGVHYSASRSFCIAVSKSGMSSSAPSQSASSSSV